LELLDPKTGEFTHHRNDPSNENSILDDAVFALYLDEQNDIIWAGTSNGLSGLHIKTGEWENYTVKDGLPSETIVGIQPGNSDDLWVSTGKGISHFLRKQNQFVNYSARDGLQGDLFEIASSQLGPDGEIFFGGSNGVTFFRPDQIAKNTFLPPVVFTDFQLFNQSVPAGSDILPEPIEKTASILLQYNQSVITIKFAALSYQLPDKNLYQYKMDGFDADWSPPKTKNEVTYTNLPPGKYTFRVKAANNDGLWNDNEERSLIIIIQPPWWETWWFRVFVIFGGFLLIVTLVQLRIKNINTINQELEKRVMERTTELEDSKKQLDLANSELKSQLAAITALEKEVRELAIHDSLTGLFNRRFLSERLQAEFSRADRGHHPIAFLLMDIDHFKNINDSYGHQAGDQTLKLVSGFISTHIRQSDIACRYGGEEFMIILPETDITDARQKAEVFRQGINDLEIEYDGHKFNIAISIGIAIYPDHGVDYDQILSMADEALYSAKKSGRNKVVVYSKDEG